MRIISVRTMTGRGEGGERVGEGKREREGVDDERKGEESDEREEEE